ncbi:hypothetical protein V6Z11_D02G109900 [Gossypium hirsutum]
MKSAFGLLITNFLHFFFSLVLFYFLPFFHFFQGLEGELPRYNNLFLVSHFLPPVSFFSSTPIFSSFHV